MTSLCAAGIFLTMEDAKPLDFFYLVFSKTFFCFSLTQSSVTVLRLFVLGHIVFLENTSSECPYWIQIQQLAPSVSHFV